MISSTTPKSKSVIHPQQKQSILQLFSSVTPSPHPHKNKGRPLEKSYNHHLHQKKHTLSSKTTVTCTEHTTSFASSHSEDKKQKTRQYNKAHREKLKQDDDKFEKHKERVRMYNAKRRQTLHVMAKEYGLSIRKMEQTLKETKKNTGVDLLSIAVNNNGDDQNMKKEEKATDADVTTARNNKNMSLQKTPPQQSQQQVDDVKKDIPAAETYLAQRCGSQTPQPSSSFKKEQPKEVTKASKTAAAKNKVITPSTTPPSGSSNLSTPAATKTTTATSIENLEKQKKHKHNQHNRAYRDKLKQDKRRYEEHKEKARQYNEKRRKKLRAMAKETGLTMKEMEKTIREAKIISALTVTASKEAEQLTPTVPPVPSTTSTTTPTATRHLIPAAVVTNPRLPLQAASITNCLDILSDAASIVLSQSNPHLHTPSSPRRQYRTVSEDNCELN